MSQTETDLSSDEIFSLLSNKRRRFILRHLKKEKQPVDLSQVVEEVAAWESDKPVEELTEDERKRVYVSLYQTHIPKLAAAGLINYEDVERTVELTDSANQIKPYIDDESTRPDWYLYYLLVVTVSMSVFVASLIGPQWIREFGNVLLPAMPVLLVGLAVVHFVYSRRKRNRRVRLVDDTR